MSVSTLRTPLVFAGFWLFFAIVFAPALFSGAFMTTGDGTNQALPTFFGRTPLVEPRMMLGYPLFADPNQAYWYPIIRLARALPDGFNAYVVFPYAIVAFGTFGFARRFSGSFAGGVAAGVTIGLGGFMIAHEQHLMLLHPACWAPYVLWAIAELRERSSRSVVVAGAIALACGSTAGSEQPLVYLSFAGIAFAWFFRPKQARERSDFFRDVAFLFVIGIALASIAIVPAAEFAVRTDRAHQTLHEFSTNSTIPLEFVLRLLFPYFLGNAASALYAQPGPLIGSFSENSNYVGILSLALAVVALLDSAMRRRAIFWCGVAAWAAWMSTGSYAGAAHVARSIPVYGIFRIPGRHAFEFTFAIAVLASLGVAALESRRVSWRSIAIAIAVPAVPLAAALVWIANSGHAILFRLSGGQDVSGVPVTPDINAALATPLAICIGASVALVLCKRFERLRYASAIALVAVAGDMLVFANASYWRDYTTFASLTRLPANVVPLAAQLERGGGRYVDLGDENTRSIHSNLATLWTLPNAVGYVSLEDRTLENLLHATPTGEIPAEYVDEGNGTTFDLAGVRYILFPSQAATVPIEDEYETPLLAGLIGNVNVASQQTVSYGFEVPRTGNAIVLVTALGLAASIPDGARVADVVVGTTERTFTFPLLAGRDTAEATYDRPDVRPLVRHARAAVFGGPADDLLFITRLALPPAMHVRSLTIRWVYAAPAVGALLVARAILLDPERRVAYPFSAASQFSQDRSHFIRRSNVYAADGERVYENVRAFPHAWVVHRAIVQSSDAQLQTVHSGEIDGRRANLRDDVVTADPIALSGGDAGDSVVPEAVDPTIETDVVRCRGTCMLVTNDLWYPGWHASVDGKPTRVRAVDYAMRGVVVPAGEHRVVMWFSPPSLEIGIWISSCAALFAVAFIVLGNARFARER